MPRDVFVVGGGPSLANFNFSVLDGKDVIAVNQSLFRLPSAKYFVTMDYTWRTRLNDPENKEQRVQFLRHPAHPRLKVHGPTDIEDTDFGFRYDLSEFSQIAFTSGYGGIGRDWSDFRVGSESGYSGLQLAVLLGYQRIYLLGYDFCISPYQTHFHQDYSNHDPVRFKALLDEYVTPYPEAIQQIRSSGIEIFSGSACSRLNQYLLYTNVESLVCQR